MFVMFWANPNKNICTKVQKNHLLLCTCFVYLRTRHVSIPLLDMLHQCTYCYTLTTLKLLLKKRQLKLKHKIQGTNVVGKYSKAFV